jgi:hypothetical protein
MREDPGTPVALEGGNVNDVVRIGDTVHRTSGPWTPTIHALLAWVRAQGVDAVPAPLGLDAEGREILSWLPGDVAGWPVPHWVWDPVTLADAGLLLREWHDASVGFDLPSAVWRSPAREPAEVVCLHDVAPYNMTHDGTRLVGFIDVDMASPGPRVWDLAYLGYRMCGWCEDMPAPAGPPPAERLEILLEGYGLDVAPTADDVLRTMVARLHELADWTEDHARTTGNDDLFEHARMYRRDAARLD